MSYLDYARDFIRNLTNHKQTKKLQNIFAFFDDILICRNKSLKLYCLARVNQILIYQNANFLQFDSLSLHFLR